MDLYNFVIKNGARLAEPGEFTKRAFLNGRIDLSEAEAVMDVISSENEIYISVKQRLYSWGFQVLPSAFLLALYLIHPFGILCGHRYHFIICHSFDLCYLFCDIW